jgi:hypothetical protein
MNPKNNTLNHNIVEFVDTTSADLSYMDSHISNISKSYIEAIYSEVDRYMRQPPKIPVTLADGVRNIPQEELIRMYQEKDELERLCVEVPGIKALRDQLHAMIKLYRE